MWIHEATKRAFESGLCITLPEFRGIAKIRPTDGSGRCVLMKADGSQPSKYGWQPSAQDLIRDDWELIG